MSKIAHAAAKIPIIAILLFPLKGCSKSIFVALKTIRIKAIIIIEYLNIFMNNVGLLDK